MTIGRLIGALALGSLAIAPWWVLAYGWSWWVPAAVIWWALVALVALFDNQDWKRRR